MNNYCFVALLSFCLFGLTSQAETCNCFSYLIAENGLSSENVITQTEYKLEKPKCDGDGLMECKNFCINLYKDLTDNGKTCVKMTGSSKLVADWMCEALKRSVCNARVGVFIQGCGSDIIDTGFRFQEAICCKGLKSIHC
ncbi:uncharacterized protein LOC129231750 [Uloborus diversus]|uniref:uncharacterized protein LOC129231750 n=1 Tax=Uloborus diversus TaxID=327109 RepID=UPI0024090FA6|nr:uncharacterized protein LOC129231750 [Uloborus diversus]